MKKQLFITIGILFSLSTFAQRISLNKSVSINIPKDAEKLTREQALAHDRKRFDSDERALNYYGNLHSVQYKVDDIVVVLKPFDTLFKFKEGHALSLKKGMDEMAKGDPTYTSILETINNNTVIVTNSIIRDTWHCYFWSFNANNTRVITGSLVYGKADKEKATAILNQILNSIKFKD